MGLVYLLISNPQSLITRMSRPALRQEPTWRNANRQWKKPLFHGVQTDFIPFGVGEEGNEAIFTDVCLGGQHFTAGPLDFA